MKRVYAAFSSTAILLAFSCTHVDLQRTSPDDAALIALARKIHDEVITLDTHVDIDTANFTDAVNYTQELPIQTDLPKMKRGGLDAIFLIVYTKQGDLSEEGYKRAFANAIDKFDAIHRLTTQIAPNEIELALTSADVRRIHSSGKKVAMIGVENAYPIGTNLSHIKDFVDRGARYLSLAHNGHNQLSDSNTGERDGKWLHNGLSELGKQAVMEANKWGLMLDVSHPSKESIHQTIQLSKAPVIASHSGARALSDHSRNLDDETLALIKKNGGVVQAVALRTFVNREKAAADVNVADFVDHIDYLVKKMGIEHVGIASDFDGGGGIEGWNNASETFNVTLELVRRGYTQEHVEKIWSGNLLRVLDEVQNVAKGMRVSPALGQRSIPF